MLLLPKTFLNKFGCLGNQRNQKFKFLFFGPAVRPTSIIFSSNLKLVYPYDNKFFCENALLITQTL